MRSLSIKNDNGFTLFEAMISLFIISIGILAITRMQLSSIDGNRSAAETTMAALILNATAEQLMSLSFSNPILNQTPTPVPTPFPVIDSRYIMTYQVTDTPIDDLNSYKRITVFTDWTASKDGRPISIQTDFIVLNNIKDI